MFWGFVNNGHLMEPGCTNLEFLHILLVVHYFGKALHSFDANDTLKS